MPRPKKTPTRRDPRTLRQLVAKAADRLDEHGDTELAAAVREHLAASTERTPAKSDTLPLWMRPATWDRAQSAAVQLSTSVEQLVDAGFEEFLAGQFRPTPAPRGGGKATFTTRAAPERRKEVTDYAKAHADELGWTPTFGQVAALWLEHRYGDPT